MSGDVTQIGMLIAAVSVLSTVITMLWRQVTKHHDEVTAELNDTREALKDCTDDRTLIWKTLAMQAGRPVDELKRESR